MSVNVAGVYTESIVDGPGIRIAIYFQGCSHHCPFCHNPVTWDFNKHMTYFEIEDFDRLFKDNPYVDGVTFSGGDPLEQEEGLEEICKLIKTKYPKLNIICYTGFDYEEIKDYPCLKYIDYLIDGRFLIAKRDLTLKFRGSSNQRFIDVKKTKANNDVVYAMSDYEIDHILD